MQDTNAALLPAGTEAIAWNVPLSSIMCTFVKPDPFISAFFKSTSSFENFSEKTSELMYLTVYDSIENKWGGSKLKEGEEE